MLGPSAGSLQVDPGPLAATCTLPLCTLPPALRKPDELEIQVLSSPSCPSCLQHPFPAVARRMCVLLEETQAPDHIKSLQGREGSFGT